MQNNDNNNDTISHGTVTRRRRAVAVVGSVVAIASIATATSFGAGAVQSASSPGQIRMAATAEQAPRMTPTPAEAKAWEEATRTPEQRQAIVDHMREAFAGIATVGADPAEDPTTGATASTDSSGGAVLASTDGGAVTVEKVVAAGMSGDHFWITASYGDIARGAIWGAVNYCKTKVPGWLCDSAGYLLRSWANGWGTGNSHGVWAAAYWAPPRVTGGRW